MTWTKEAYFAKATVMWEKATSHSRDSFDYYFHFAFFLEHVIRGTLVSRNPALNAARNEESLLYAVGADARGPKSIDLASALGYVRRLIPEISEAENTGVGVLVDFRNAELHDDSTQFDEAVLKQVIPDCQMFVMRLLEFAQAAPEDVLGKEDASRFEASRRAKTGDRKRRVRALIETAKDRFFHLSREEQRRLKEEKAPQFISAIMKGGRHIRQHKCPSCAGLGLIGGQPYGTSAPMLRDDDLKVEVRVIPDVFECKICGLHLKGLDEILAAQLPHEFTSVDSVDIMEHFGVDPMDYIDAEEIARSYHDEAYGYQDE
jgi:hypothetical protein